MAIALPIPMTVFQDKLIGLRCPGGSLSKAVCILKRSLTVRDNGNLAGGLIFSVFGEWLEVEFLWVDGGVRGRGVGRNLLERAETFAKDCGCKTAVVYTMSFQAKPFYEKNGYVLMHTQNNYPVTSSRYYLEKKLIIA
jgi:GNAT superfamily N-acetyltransferase